jgi:hypothetical protein
MRTLAILLALLIAALGVGGVADPTALVAVGRYLSAPPALYAVAAARIAFGAILIAAAPGSRLPRALHVVGWVIVVAGVATPFLGPLGDGIMDWVEGAGTLVVRLWAGLAILLGLFLALALRPRR